MSLSRCECFVIFIVLKYKVICNIWISFSSLETLARVATSVRWICILLFQPRNKPLIVSWYFLNIHYKQWKSWLSLRTDDLFPLSAFSRLITWALKPLVPLTAAEMPRYLFSCELLSGISTFPLFLSSKSTQSERCFTLCVHLEHPPLWSHWRGLMYSLSVGRNRAALSLLSEQGSDCVCSARCERTISSCSRCSSTEQTDLSPLSAGQASSAVCRQDYVWVLQSFSSQRLSHHQLLS